jgi:hypothetical protein
MIRLKGTEKVNFFFKLQNKIKLLSKIKIEIVLKIINYFENNQNYNNYVALAPIIFTFNGFLNGL